MQLKYGLNDIPDIADPVYIFNPYIIHHELNYQKRIEYKNLDASFLCWLFACFLTEHMSRGEIQESIFRTVIATEIFIQLNGLDVVERTRFVEMLEEKLDSDAKSYIAYPLDKAREEELADNLVDPIIVKIIEKQSYYIGLGNTYSTMMNDLVRRINARWN